MDEILEFLDKKLRQPQFMRGQQVTIQGRLATIGGWIKPTYDPWRMSTWHRIHALEPKYAVVLDDTEDMVIATESYLKREQS